MTLTEKVLIRLNATRGVESFSDIDATHAAIGCAGCHGGYGEVDAEDDTSAYRAAHKGMIRDPSAVSENGCSGGMCHADIVRRNETSMHTNLWGEKAHVAMRNGYNSFEECPAEIQDGFAKDCSGCHTTCGQCHVSRPHTAGKGFLEQRVGYSHKFIATPSEENVCTACHGSRVGDDWNANQERVPGNKPDVHNDFGYTCLDCHQEDFHGDGSTDADYMSRYHVENLPQCTDCHQVDSDDNEYHVQHWPNSDATDGADLACYVCHSQQYNNCNTCHAGEWTHEYVEEADWATSEGGYRVYPQFKIGRNPVYGESSNLHGNSAWIAVRHIPISPDAYEHWDIPEWTVDNFAAGATNMETWKFASPHNIQRWTARTLVDPTWADSSAYTADNCADNCHMHGTYGASIMVNDDLYLENADMQSDMTGDDLSHEIDANENTSLGDDGCYYSACHVSHN